MSYLALFNFLFILILTLTLLFLITSVAITLYIKLKYESLNAICKSNERLDNKIVLITGGNQGIGFETARDLSARGAKVIIASRNAQKSAEAVADIIKTTGNKNIEFKHLDLSKFSSVRQFAQDFNKSYDRLDILINNAGCAILKHKPSVDGIDMVMQVNYLGPFLLTNLLLDKIKASEAGRIIIVSSFIHLFARLKPSQLSGMHTRRYITKYNNSKLCNVLWMKALAKRLPSNVTVNALHPGCIKTDLLIRITPLLWRYLNFLMNVFKFKTAKEGAQTTIYLAVSEEVAGVSGKYFMECMEAEYSRAAHNNDLVEKVWNESVRLTNLRLNYL